MLLKHCWRCSGLVSLRTWFDSEWEHHFRVPVSIGISVKRRYGQVMELVYVTLSKRVFCGFESHLAHQFICPVLWIR